MKGKRRAGLLFQLAAPSKVCRMFSVESIKSALSIFGDNPYVLFKFPDESRVFACFKEKQYSSGAYMKALFEASLLERSLLMEFDSDETRNIFCRLLVQERGLFDLFLNTIKFNDWNLERLNFVNENNIKFLGTCMI